MKHPRFYCRRCGAELKPTLDRGYLATDHNCPETVDDGLEDVGTITPEGRLDLYDGVEMVVVDK